MGSWKKIDETELQPKKDFYSNLNLENINNDDYIHAQKVWDVFEITYLGKYHDLYVQSDTLLLADIFEKFSNMCLIYMNLVLYICTWIRMQSWFKKDWSKVRINNRL